MRKSTPRDVKRAAKWNKDHPERRREIINRSNRKRMDKIVQWGREHPEARNQTVRKNQRKVREKVMKVVGHACRLCGKDGREHDGRSVNGVQFHERHYKPHPQSASALWYILKHPEDFIPLCIKCHTVVEYLHDVFGVSIEEIEIWLKERKR